MPRLLGRRVPRRTLAWCTCATLLGLLLRLMYPLAAVLFGRHRGSAAGAMVALSVVVAALAGGASSRAVRSIRPLIFGALASAASRQPYPLGSVSYAQVESEIARGAPWVEAHVAKTLPGLAANLLALPLIAALAIAQLGLRATLVGMAGLFLAALIGGIGIRWAVRLGTAAWRSYRGVSRLMERGVRGAGELRVHGLGRRYERALFERVQNWTHLERRAAAASVLSAWSIPAVAIGATVLLMSILGGVPLGALSTAFLRAGRGALIGGLLVVAALPVLIGLARTLSQVGSQRASLELLEKFVARQVPERPARAGSPAIGMVRLDQVMLRYAHEGEGAPDTEIHADLEWAPGSSLALRGATGSGKTTVLHLVAGLLEPTVGSVEVEADGQAVGPEALVGSLVYVPQQAYFDDLDTVRDAIRFMAPRATDAGILDLLQQLKPSQQVTVADLDQTVGSLSAGQRRVVALVRGLLCRPGLMIVDEPELNLDRASVSALARVLREAKQSCRLLMATHDSELASVADEVLEFDGHSIAMPVRGEPAAAAG